MLDVRLFRNPRFTAASASIALAFFGLFGFIFLITQYFQVVRGYDPLRAGVATLPFAIVTGALSPVAITADEAGRAPRLVVTGGPAADERRLRWSRPTTRIDAAYWGRIIIAMALMAAGLGLTASPATEAIMGALPPDKAGAGSAVNDTTRELGGTLGVAIVGSVLSSAYGSHVVSALTGLGRSRAGGLAGRAVRRRRAGRGRSPAARTARGGRGGRARGLHDRAASGVAGGGRCDRRCRARGADLPAGPGTPGAARRRSVGDCCGAGEVRGSVRPGPGGLRHPVLISSLATCVPRQARTLPLG